MESVGVLTMYLFSNGAFYAYSIRDDYGVTWPSSGVDVSDEDHSVWIGTPPNGKVLGVDGKGAPVWVDIPEPVRTYAQELTAITAPYNTDRDTLCAAWLRAAVADGTEENVRKADVEAELAELDAQYDADVAALKTKYGVS